MEELGLFLGLGDDANYQLANPSLLAYYKELNERRLWLDCEVDDEAIGDMCRQIIRWNKEDDAIEPSKRKKIIIYFVSPGGSLDSYLWLKDVINLSITPIVGIMMSRTASAAALIYLHCHERYALESSKILFHYGSISLAQDAANAIESMKKYEQEIKKFVDVIREHSDFSDDYIRNKLVKDWELTADEALEHGIVQKIISDISELWN